MFALCIIHRWHIRINVIFFMFSYFLVLNKSLCFTIAKVGGVVNMHNRLCMAFLYTKSVVYSVVIVCVWLN